MSRVKMVLEEITHLAPEEAEQVYNELSKRMKRAERAVEILEKYRGRGAGVWGEDAQEYINTLRTDDRL